MRNTSKPPLPQGFSTSGLTDVNSGEILNPVLEMM
jgi:hypothetical protein